eukprot:6209902-Pleurochrysis_carterae.AAC.2
MAREILLAALHPSIAALDQSKVRQHALGPVDGIRSQREEHPPLNRSASASLPTAAHSPLLPRLPA